MIFSGPLRGTAFGAGGMPFQYEFGTVYRNFMTGGDWEASEMSGNSTLSTPQERQTAFGRVSYDVTDNVNVFAQFSYNTSYQESKFCCFVLYDINISVNDNPFLPASVRQQAQSLNLRTLTLGSILDGSLAGALSERWVNRYVAGAEGNFDSFGGEWKWNAYYQYGVSREDSYRIDSTCALDLTRRSTQ